MRITRLAAASLAAATALALAACGGGSDSTPETAPSVEAAPSFAAGSTMARLADAGKVKIGVKVDQPGIGYQQPGGEHTGFDIEIGQILAAGLGIQPDSVEWIETISKNREPFLQNGTVDMVLASYSITDERRQVVGQAGPYYVTGQQLLVRKSDDSITGPDSLKGKKVCSVTGSTSIKTVQEKYGATPVPFGTYSECVQQLLNNQVDAVTTDGAILLGYAADDPDNLKVVGDAFSEERYGVGYKKGDEQFCGYITDTLKKAEENGDWKKAFEATLGKAGVEAPEPPPLDPCQ